MNAPPFPLNPSTGEFFGNWVWNGARWVCTPGTGPRVITTVFTASGPYMPSPGLVSLVVECIGGGGGGGAVATTTATYIVTGGGGGSGGYSRKTLAAALVQGGVLVTIGAGGTCPAGDGLPGGATSFGALCVANGGNGGNGNNDTTGFGASGRGGLPGVGDVTLSGNQGQNGIVHVAATPTFSAGESYGGSMWGGSNGAGSVGPGAAGPGSNGDANTGAGGSGAVANQVITSSTTNQGGTGGSGLAIVTEYCWADASGDDCSASPGQTLNVDARVALEREPWGHRPPGKPGWRPTGFSGDPNAYEEGE